MIPARDYVAIESLGHRTAAPLLTIAIDRGRLILFGVSTRLLKTLTAAERTSIVETVRTILEERSHHDSTYRTSNGRPASGARRSE